MGTNLSAHRARRVFALGRTFVVFLTPTMRPSDEVLLDRVEVCHAYVTSDDLVGATTPPVCSLDQWRLLRCLRLVLGRGVCLADVVLAADGDAIPFSVIKAAQAAADSSTLIATREFVGALRAGLSARHGSAPTGTEGGASGKERQLSSLRKLAGLLVRHVQNGESLDVTFEQFAESVPLMQFLPQRIRVGVWIKWLLARGSTTDECLSMIPEMCFDVQCENALLCFIMASRAKLGGVSYLASKPGKVPLDDFLVIQAMAGAELPWRDLHRNPRFPSSHELLFTLLHAHPEPLKILCCLAPRVVYEVLWRGLQSPLALARKGGHVRYKLVQNILAVAYGEAGRVLRGVGDRESAAGTIAVIKSLLFEELDAELGAIGATLRRVDALENRDMAELLNLGVTLRVPPGAGAAFLRAIASVETCVGGFVENQPQIRDLVAGDAGSDIATRLGGGQAGALVGPLLADYFASHDALQRGLDCDKRGSTSGLLGHDFVRHMRAWAYPASEGSLSARMAASGCAPVRDAESANVALRSIEANWSAVLAGFQSLHAASWAVLVLRSRTQQQAEWLAFMLHAVHARAAVDAPMRGIMVVRTRDILAQLDVSPFSGSERRFDFLQALTATPTELLTAGVQLFCTAPAFPGSFMRAMLDDDGRCTLKSLEVMCRANPASPVYISLDNAVTRRAYVAQFERGWAKPEAAAEQVSLHMRVIPRPCFAALQYHFDGLPVSGGVGVLRLLTWALRPFSRCPVATGEDNFGALLVIVQVAAVDFAETLRRHRMSVSNFAVFVGVVAGLDVENTLPADAFNSFVRTYLGRTSPWLLPMRRFAVSLAIGAGGNDPARSHCYQERTFLPPGFSLLEPLAACPIFESVSVTCRQMSSQLRSSLKASPRTELLDACWDVELALTASVSNGSDFDSSMGCSTLLAHGNSVERLLRALVTATFKVWLYRGLIGTPDRAARVAAADLGDDDSCGAPTWIKRFSMLWTWAISGCELKVVVDAVKRCARLVRSGASVDAAAAGSQFTPSAFKEWLRSTLSSAVLVDLGDVLITVPALPGAADASPPSMQRVAYLQAAMPARGQQWRWIVPFEAPSKDRVAGCDVYRAHERPRLRVFGLPRDEALYSYHCMYHLVPNADDAWVRELGGADAIIKDGFAAAAAAVADVGAMKSFADNAACLAGRRLGMLLVPATRGRLDRTVAWPWTCVQDVRESIAAAATFFASFLDGQDDPAVIDATSVMGTFLRGLVRGLRESLLRSGFVRRPADSGTDKSLQSLTGAMRFVCHELSSAVGFYPRAKQLQKGLLLAFARYGEGAEWAEKNAACACCMLQWSKHAFNAADRDTVFDDIVSGIRRDGTLAHDIVGFEALDTTPDVSGTLTSDVLYQEHLVDGMKPLTLKNVVSWVESARSQDGQFQGGQVARDGACADDDIAQGAMPDGADVGSAPAATGGGDDAGFSALEEQRLEQPASAAKGCFFVDDLLAVSCRTGVVEVSVKPGRDITLYQLDARSSAYRFASRSDKELAKCKIISTFQSHEFAWRFVQTFAAQVTVVVGGMLLVRNAGGWRPWLADCRTDADGPASFWEMLDASQVLCMEIPECVEVVLLAACRAVRSGCRRAGDPAAVDDDSDGGGAVLRWLSDAAVSHREAVVRFTKAAATCLHEFVSTLRDSAGSRIDVLLAGSALKYRPGDADLGGLAAEPEERAVCYALLSKYLSPSDGASGTDARQVLMHALEMVSYPSNRELILGMLDAASKSVKDQRVLPLLAEYTMVRSVFKRLSAELVLELCEGRSPLEGPSVAAAAATAAAAPTRGRIRGYRNDPEAGEVGIVRGASPVARQLWYASVPAADNVYSSSTGMVIMFISHEGICSPYAAHRLLAPKEPGSFDLGTWLVDFLRAPVSWDLKSELLAAMQCRSRCRGVAPWRDEIVPTTQRECDSGYFLHAPSVNEYTVVEATWRRVKKKIASLYNFVFASWSGQHYGNLFSGVHEFGARRWVPFYPIEDPRDTSLTRRVGGDSEDQYGMRVVDAGLEGKNSVVREALAEFRIPFAMVDLGHARVTESDAGLLLLMLQAQRDHDARVVYVTGMPSISDRLFKWVAEVTQRTPWLWFFFEALNESTLLPENLDRLVREDAALRLPAHEMKNFREQRGVLFKSGFRCKASLGVVPWRAHLKASFETPEALRILAVGAPGIGKTQYIERDILWLDARYKGKTVTMNGSDDAFTREALSDALHRQVPASSSCLLVMDEFHMLAPEMKAQLLRWHATRPDVKLLLIANRCEEEDKCLVLAWGARAAAGAVTRQDGTQVNVCEITQCRGSVRDVLWLMVLDLASARIRGGATYEQWKSDPCDLDERRCVQAMLFCHMWFTVVSLMFGTDLLSLRRVSVSSPLLFMMSLPWMARSGAAAAAGDARWAALMAGDVPGKLAEELLKYTNLSSAFASAVARRVLGLFRSIWNVVEGTYEAKAAAASRQTLLEAMATAIDARVREEGQRQLLVLVPPADDVATIDAIADLCIASCLASEGDTGGAGGTGGATPRYAMSFAEFGDSGEVLVGANLHHVCVRLASWLLYLRARWDARVCTAGPGVGAADTNVAGLAEFQELLRRVVRAVVVDVPGKFPILDAATRNSPVALSSCLAAVSDAQPSDMQAILSALRRGYSISWSNARRYWAAHPFSNPSEIAQLLACCPLALTELLPAGDPRSDGGDAACIESNVAYLLEVESSDASALADACVEMSPDVPLHDRSKSAKRLPLMARWRQYCASRGACATGWTDELLAVVLAWASENASLRMSGSRSAQAAFAHTLRRDVTRVSCFLDGRIGDEEAQATMIALWDGALAPYVLECEDANKVLSQVGVPRRLSCRPYVLLAKHRVCACVRMCVLLLLPARLNAAVPCPCSFERAVPKQRGVEGGCRGAERDARPRRPRPHPDRDAGAPDVLG